MEEFFRVYQMLNNLAKSWSPASSFLKSAYLPLTLTYPWEEQLICHGCIYLTKIQTDKWIKTLWLKFKGVLEFWKWPAHASSHVKMLGRGRLSCQDPLRVCCAKSDTGSPWRAGDPVHGKRQGWVLQPELTHTHRHTNHTHPPPNTEKCNLNLPHVCGKENKAASPPPSAPFPHFPSSLQPEFPVEEGTNGHSSQCFSWETCSEGISFLRASDLPEKPTLAAGNYFIPATEWDLNPM